MVTNYAVFSGELSSKFCDLICEISKLYPEKDATVYQKHKSSITDARSSKLRWINEYKHQEINIVLNSYLNKVNREMLGFDVSYGPGAFQYTEYSAEAHGHFDWHIDTLYDNNAVSDRKVTLCVHLSDPSDYEGGVFCLDSSATPKFDVDSFKPRGSIIIFPSYLKHCVTKVTKGTRKSLVLWYNGPRFR